MLFFTVEKDVGWHMKNVMHGLELIGNSALNLIKAVFCC
jgi:hypothetical protein